MVLTSLSAFRRTAITNSRPLFYIATRTRTWNKYLQLLDAPEFFQSLPHRTLSPLKYTEMVATALDSCQLHIARRIFAEIQLRINGFNTYG